MWQAAEELLMKDDGHICNLLLPSEKENKSCRPLTTTALDNANSN